MRIIEPCCYHKQLEGLIDECTKSGSSAHFFSYSDWDLNDLFSTLSGYASGGEMGLVLVRCNAQILSKIKSALSRVVPDPENPSRSVPDIRKITLVVQPASTGSVFDHRREIRSLMPEFIRSGRLVVCEDNVGFRCVSVKGRRHTLVVQGSLNLDRSGSMQMFTLTASRKEYDQVAEMLSVKEHTKQIFRPTAG